MKTINVKFTVMLADIQERINNVQLIGKQIPNLHVYVGDNHDIFMKYVNCFNIDERLDGVVVLEDDIQLCNNFHSAISKIIHNHPEDVISFFEKPNSKKELKTSYIKGSEFLFNQCNYYPRSVCELLLNQSNIDEFKANYFSKYKKWVAPIDLYIAFVLNKYRIKYRMQVPFLVQHLCFKSTLGNRSTKRQTKYFIDDYENCN
jgi:hypothetical protein